MTLERSVISNHTYRILILGSEIGVLSHGTILQTGITCKKIPCYMHNSACRWFIVKKPKIAQPYFLTNVIKQS